jgi:hypothetical protein
MAIQITATITTNEGFVVDSAFAFLNIYLLNDNWVNISYYKSENDWKAGLQSLNVNLPSRVSTDLTLAEFWGNGLVTLIHNKCIAQIEETTGAGTCEIVQG